MKLKIGDRVKFLNATGGGRITGIVDKKTVTVEDENGFDIPTLISELVLTDGDMFTQVTGEKAPAEETKPVDEFTDIDNDIILEVGANYEIVEDNKDAKIYLALKAENPDNFNDSGLNLYLINDSNYKVLYNLSENDTYKNRYLKAGFLESGNKILIWSFTAAKLQDTIKLNVQGVVFKKGLYDLSDPLNETIELKPTKMRKESSFKPTDYFHEPAYLIPVTKTDMEKQMEKLSDKDFRKIQREKDDLPKKAKKKDTNPAIEEVDLHIEELVDSKEGMSNGEILETQMSRFETALMGGVNGKTKKMVFIHGVGNGKLKHELRKKLERKYAQLVFQDASFKEYGYGATLVIIRK